MLGLFHDETLGREAAIALGVIVDDEDRVLSKENFAVLRVRIPSFHCDLFVGKYNDNKD